MSQTQPSCACLRGDVDAYVFLRANFRLDLARVVDVTVTHIFLVLISMESMDLELERSGWPGYAAERLLRVRQIVWRP